MKDYWAMYYKIYDEMYNAGIEIGDIEEIKINSRAKSRWGRCSYNRLTDSYTIEISDRLVADNVDDMALANTLAHEMLHTVKGCMNHGAEWKAYADVMNTEYGKKKMTACFLNQLLITNQLKNSLLSNVKTIRHTA